MDADQVARTLVEPQRVVPRLDAAVTVDGAPADGALVLLPAGELAWLPAEMLRNAEGPGLARVVRPVAALAVVVRTLWVACEPAEASAWALDHVDAEYVYLRRGGAGDPTALYRVLPEDIAAADDDEVWRAVCPWAVIDASPSPSAWEAFSQRFLGGPGELPGVRNAERWSLNLGPPEAAAQSTPFAADEPAPALRARDQPSVPVRCDDEPSAGAPQLERLEVPIASSPAAPGVPRPILKTASPTPWTQVVRESAHPSAEVHPTHTPEVPRSPARAVSPERAMDPPRRAPGLEAKIAREPDVVPRLERHSSQRRSPQPATSVPAVGLAAPVTAPRPRASGSTSADAPLADLREPAPTLPHERTRTTDEAKLRAVFATRPPSTPREPLQRELPGRAVLQLDAARFDLPRREEPRSSPRTTDRHDAPPPASEVLPTCAAFVTAKRVAARRGEPAPARDYRVGAATVELGVVVVSLGERDEQPRGPEAAPTWTGTATPTRTGSLLAEIPVSRGWRSEL